MNETAGVALFRAMGDSTRLKILRSLSLSDLTAGEIVRRLGLRQNAVSYHLRQLRDAGLLRQRHSSLDARDLYYSIDLERLQDTYAAAGRLLHQEPPPPTSTKSLRVLFLCTHNSARSQLAEALLRHLGGPEVEAHSAGTDPTEVHPLANRLLYEWGIETSDLRSKALSAFINERFDYVITVCDRVRDAATAFPGGPALAHWSLPDPITIRDPIEQLSSFTMIRSELAMRISHLLALARSHAGATA